MRVYTVHLKDGATGPDPDRNLVLIKDGFCWPAMFLSFLWAAWHRMWAVAVLIALVFGVSGWAMAALGVGYDASFAAHALLGVGLGFLGNRVRRWHLARRGFRAVGGVTGANMDEAEERYFHERGVPGQLTGAGA